MASWHPSEPEVKRGTATMIMKTGEHWHCTNPACHCEVLVQSASEFGGSNPRCVCGSPMKKTYTPPNLTYLEFLRAEEPISVPVGSRKG
jgi:hypothetical protein